MQRTNIPPHICQPHIPGGWAEYALEGCGHVYRRYDIDKTMHALKRLADPFIANRVKKLEIKFRYFELAGSSITMPHVGSTIQDNRKSFKTMMRRPVNGILSTFRQRRSIHAPTSPDKFPPPRSWLQLVSRIIQALPECRNVNELRLDWMVIPSSYDPKVVLRNLWARSPAGPNLKSLFLSGDLAFYQAFTETMPPFPQLATLRIQYAPDYYAQEQELLDDSPVLLSHVIPFINGISLNLQSLCVHSFITLVGLPAFFNNLPVLPVLHDLIISLYVDGSSEDLSPLYLFLDGCHSNTLRYLDLKLYTFVREQEEDLSKSLLRFFTSRSQSFINLQSLTINPTSTARAVDIIIAVLQKTRTTLQKLRVRDRVFNSEELVRIFDAAGHCRRLIYLRIHIDCLDWIVLEILAEKLPRLRTLSVIANEQPTFIEEEQLDVEDGMNAAPAGYIPLRSLWEEHVYVAKSRLNRMTIRQSNDGALDVDNKFTTARWCIHRLFISLASHNP